MTKRGPTGPNHYRELEGEDRREPVPETSPAPAARTEVERIAPEPVSRSDNFRHLQRQDNQALHEAYAAEQHAARRAAKDREVREAANESTEKLSEQANQLEAVRTRFDAAERGPIEQVEEKILGRAEGRQTSGDLYHRALDQHAGDDPFETLRRAAGGENAMFHEQLDVFDERIAVAPSLDERVSLEQQKDIFAADHLASTSHRIADQDEIITGLSPDQMDVDYREKAAGYEAESADLRTNFQTRTGRDYEPETPPEASNHEVSEGQKQEAQKAPEVVPPQREPERAWSNASIEVTASMERRLALLDARFSESEGRGSEEREQAERPTDRGGTTY